MEELQIGDLTFTKYGMLYIEEYETGVIADLHLGYEEVMATKGIFLPKIQKRHILSILDKIFESYEPKKLIINGDFKHEFSKNMRQEWNEIEYVLDYLLERTNLVVVRGNHDNFLSGILRKRGISMGNSHEIGKYIFVHGHNNLEIDKTRVTIIGHEHPSVSIRDKIAATIKIPCFLHSPDIVVIPAMSIYASGTDITKNDYISPILRRNPRDFKIIGIDEKVGIIPLGKISSLQALSEGW